jgi:hypothetical protein
METSPEPWISAPAGRVQAIGYWHGSVKRQQGAPRAFRAYPYGSITAERIGYIRPTDAAAFTMSYSQKTGEDGLPAVRNR